MQEVEIKRLIQERKGMENCIIPVEQLMAKKLTVREQYL